jgi:hypothetical protein
MTSDDIPDTICEVQDAPSSAASIPLVLIHDGGGTVFNYWTLGPLHRQMYAISDPAFDSGAEWKGWEGGLEQMAELYCNMIRREIGRSKILLGGKCVFDSPSCTSASLHVNYFQDGRSAVSSLFRCLASSPKATTSWSKALS